MYRLRDRIQSVHEQDRAGLPPQSLGNCLQLGPRERALLCRVSEALAHAQ